MHTESWEESMCMVFTSYFHYWIPEQRYRSGWTVFLFKDSNYLTSHYWVHDIFLWVDGERGPMHPINSVVDIVLCCPHKKSLGLICEKNLKFEQVVIVRCVGDSRKTVSSRHNRNDGHKNTERLWHQRQGLHRVKSWA